MNSFIYFPFLVFNFEVRYLFYRVLFSILNNDFVFVWFWYEYRYFSKRFLPLGIQNQFWSVFSNRLWFYRCLKLGLIPDKVQHCPAVIVLNESPRNYTVLCTPKVVTIVHISTLVWMKSVKRLIARKKKTVHKNMKINLKLHRPN